MSNKHKRLLSCVAARAVAMSLLELPGVSGADGDTPASHEVERDFVHAGLAWGGRLVFCQVGFLWRDDIFSSVCVCPPQKKKKKKKKIPINTCEISLGKNVCELVFGVNMIDLDLRSGFWKHVSLSDFFPFWSSWSLFRCFQTQTTMILVAKIERLREQNRHYLNLWWLFEIDCVFDLSRQTTGLTVLSCIWVVFPRTEAIRSHKSRAGTQFYLNPVSKEMISYFVNLCETEVCFLHIQLIGSKNDIEKRTVFLQK